MKEENERNRRRNIEEIGHSDTSVFVTYMRQATSA